MTTPKKKQSPKAAAASKKNLENWEKAQEARAKVSNDKEVFQQGFEAGKALKCHERSVAGMLIGGSVVLIAAFIVMGLK